MLVRVYDFLTEDKPKFCDNLVGVIDDIISFKYTRRAYDIGSFELQVPTFAQDADTITPDRMLIVGDNTRYAYIVGTTKKTVSGNLLYITGVERNDEYVSVTGYDLKYLLSLRVTLFPADEQDKGTYGYYVTSGTTFACISDLINYNLTLATDTDRKIYGMYAVTMPVTQIDAGLTGIQDDRYMTRLEPLSTAIFNLLKNCKTHFYEVSVIIDDDAGSPDGYNPRMESGEDKPVIVISDDKYNIRAYSKTDDTSAYKNAIYAVSGGGGPHKNDTLVKLVKRSDGATKSIKRKEVVVDVDADSVNEIDRYALKAAEEYTVSDDFEITPIFYDDYETAPVLAQKVIVKIGNATYDTIVTEITDEYTATEHKVTYTTGNKKLKVLNVLNRSIAGNTQKIIGNKLDLGKVSGVGRFTNDAKNSEIFNDYDNNKINEGDYCHVEGQSNNINGGSVNHIEGYGNSVTNGTENSVSGYCNTLDSNHATQVSGGGNTVNGSGYTHVSGYGNNVTNGSYIDVSGGYNTATGGYSYITGANNQLNNGVFDIIGGQYNIVSGDEDLVVGNRNTVAGDSNIVAGYENTVNGTYDTINGNNNTIDSENQNTAVFGNNNSVSGGNGNAVVGGNNTLSGASDCVVAGNYNSVSQNNSYAFGAFLQKLLSSSCNTVFGKYNLDKNLPLSIGNGTGDNNRSNALELDWDGNLTIAGKLSGQIEIDTITNMEIAEMIQSILGS